MGRPAPFDERDVDRELAVAGEKLARAVQGIDQKEAVGSLDARKAALGAGLLGHARHAGKNLGQGGQDDRLGRFVRLGDGGAVALQPRRRAGMIVAQDFLARRFGDTREGGKKIAAHAARPRIARQMLSGVAGMSIWETPHSPNASTSALTMAGGAPMAPASPAP
jgi:hypothetical protein